MAEKWEGLLRSHPVFIFDFDGTLTPIRSHRDRVRLSPRTRGLLQILCERYPVAILSGRRRSDLRQCIAGIKPRYVIGNHGIEWSPPWQRAKSIKPLIQAWAKELERSLSEISGIEIENKEYSLTLHFRSGRKNARLKRAATKVASRLAGAFFIPGKRSINILASPRFTKGMALRRICRLSKRRHGLFVGDDVTDEAAFQACRETGIWGIHVGKSRRSHARFYLPNQAGIDELLARLTMPLLG